MEQDIHYRTIRTCPSINLADYEIDSLNPGEIHLAQEKRSGRKVAMKIFNPQKKEDLDFFYSALNATLLDFPGILKPIGYCFPLTTKESDSPDQNSYIIVTEYMKNGTLEDFNKRYHKHKHSRKNKPTIRSKIIFGIPAIMKKVHKRNIIHRDLRPQNIFLDSNFEPQIGNFSCSAFAGYIREESIVGAFTYIPPEVLTNEESCWTSTDVYSYAIVLYQMFAKELIYEDGSKRQKTLEILRAAMEGMRYVKPANIPEHYWELIQRCWAPNSDDRPTFEEITEILKDDKYALREEGEVNMDELHEYQQRIDSCNINEGDLSKMKTSQQRIDSSNINEGDLSKMKSYLQVLKEKSTESAELVNFEDYEEGHVIGEGATSAVKEVWKKEKYAKKELKEFDHPTLQRFLKETEVLVQLRHPCIVRIFGFDYGTTTRPPSIYLSYEASSLETSIKNHTLSNEEKNRITVEIVLGMRYIHSQKLMHRDLKPGNILLSKHKHVRISDFGLVKEEDITTSQTKGVGTLRFMAPELLDEDETNGVVYTNKVDVYAFGIILIYILNENYPPFKMSSVIKGILPSLPSTIVSWVVDLIKKCLSVSSDDRPTFDEIFSILKSHQYDLFSETYPSKPSAAQRKSKEEIEHRILKIEAFEYQHNL